MSTYSIDCSNVQDPASSSCGIDAGTSLAAADRTCDENPRTRRLHRTKVFKTLTSLQRSVPVGQVPPKIIRVAESTRPEKELLRETILCMLSWPVPVGLVPHKHVIPVTTGQTASEEEPFFTCSHGQSLWDWYRASIRLSPPSQLHLNPEVPRPTCNGSPRGTDPAASSVYPIECSKVRIPADNSFGTGADACSGKVHSST